MASVNSLVDVLHVLDYYITSLNHYLTVIQDPYPKPWATQQLQFYDQQIHRIQQQIQEHIYVWTAAVRPPPQQ